MTRPIPSITLEIPPEAIERIEAAAPWALALNGPADIYIVHGGSVVVVHVGPGVGTFRTLELSVSA